MVIPNFSRRGYQKTLLEAVLHRGRDTIPIGLIAGARNLYLETVSPRLRVIYCGGTSLICCYKSSLFIRLAR